MKKKKEKKNGDMDPDTERVLVKKKCFVRPQIKILGKVCHSMGSYHQVCGLCQILWSSK